MPLMSHLHKDKSMTGTKQSLCGYERPEANSAFRPSGVGKWGPASAGKAKAGVVHSVTACAGKTVRFLEKACHA